MQQKIKTKTKKAKAKNVLTCNKCLTKDRAYKNFTRIIGLDYQQKQQ